MAVDARRGAVGSPASVSDAAVGIENLFKIEVLAVDKLLQLGNLAHLLEGKHLVLLVAIDGKTSRVVTTVLETGKAWIRTELAVSYRCFRVRSLVDGGFVDKGPGKVLVLYGEEQDAQALFRTYH